MNLHVLIDRLAHFPRALEQVVAMVGDDAARFKPAVASCGTPAPAGDGHWSILEICCHLRDEEREDFRVRLESTLRDPGAAWPAIDFERIATTRGYQRESLESALDEFAAAREVNVAWLRGLPPMSALDWNHAHLHPSGHEIRAGDLMASWAAHDALHLRQIAKRLHELAARDAGYDVTYAGDWRA